MDQEKEDEFKIKKSFLKRYTRIQKRIERLEYKLFMLDEKLYTVKNASISDLPRGGQPVTIDDILIRKEETEERINQLVMRSIGIRSEIYDVIDQLEDYRHVEVLEHFFIDDMSIEAIADKTGYTVRHTIRFYTKAIELLDISKCQ